jgi:4-hydroxybenzoyl-CoA reductase subunit beta
MSMSDFKLLRPRTVDDAVTMLAKHAPAGTLSEPNAKLARGGLQVLAGGTDLLPSMRQKLFEPEYVLDIRGIRALSGVRELPDGSLEIGALTTLSAIEHFGVIAKRYPVLREAAKTVASPILRNMGTLGGNICLDTRCLWYNQSLLWRTSCGFCIKKDGDLCHVAPGGTFCWAAFSGDTPPALLCLDAEVEIAGPGGTRRVALRNFYTNVGDARINLEKTEILTRVILPASTANWRGVYLKLRLRGSIDYPLAGVAAVVKCGDGQGPGNDGGKAHSNGFQIDPGHINAARIAITAVNPAPLLVKGLDRVLIGKAIAEVTDAVAAEVGELAARTAKPLTTSVLTPEYRREIVRVYAKRAILAALKT